MHLAIPFTLLMGSFVAAAPSFQHAQISVEVTHVEAQNQADTLHSSEELVMNHGGTAHKNLPFIFTLSARHVYGDTHTRLPFGFENLNAEEDFNRGELGLSTFFRFRGGKLISGNRALGYHDSKIWPSWTSLWPLNVPEPHETFNLIAISESKGGILHYSIEFENPHEFFGANQIIYRKPVFVSSSQEFQRHRIVLEVEPVSKSFDDFEADSAEELL